MGHIIAALSQKGGPGKSTIARAIATTYAKAGWDVKIADLDVKQSSTVDWHRRRLESQINPVIAVESFGTARRALKAAELHDLLVVDGAPHASEATVEVAKAADLVVIPTSLSLDDLNPAVLLARSLSEKHGIPVDRIAIALSKCGDSAVEIAEARDYLGQTPFHVLGGQIPEKTSFRRAQDAGLSIVECPHPSTRAKADEVVQAIIDRFEKIAL
ncbi:ParA family protein [Salinicola corii]|uniref:ParA family protein n=1 Tax=Salinicola corii TaxID=2606937 RepID=A0A640W8H0_9GAMM|nr:ParA family protein [Salinicola corii]KAA0015474.1 ParA family protein [Salinicola corii]